MAEQGTLKPQYDQLRSTRAGSWIFGLAAVLTVLGLVAAAGLAFIKAQAWRRC